MKKRLLEKIHICRKFTALETIEEKSFWIVAPLIALLGLVGMTTAPSYESFLPLISASVFCLIIPVILMAFVSKMKCYHWAYPLLCIFIGAVAMPVTFAFSGGFLSCSTLYCVVTTSLTALCYSPRLRYISFFTCLLSTTAAFVYVYLYGSPFPIRGSEVLYTQPEAIYPVYDDIIFGYYLASVAMFFSVHCIINDIRKYRLSQETLKHYFDKNKSTEILSKASSDEKSLIGPEHKKAVIVFADISNFTAITENMSSDLISAFLNEFYSEAGNYIHSTGGIIDKYIGDCVMAYWFDSPNTNCVLNAVEAMLHMKADLIHRSGEIYEKYGTELIFSVGIAYGDVIFGDIGSESMHDYTVIGDAVNTASRIEAAAVSGEMLLSENAAKMVQNTVELEKVESDHFFKGKNKPIDLYRILGIATEQQNNVIVDREIFGYAVHVCGCRGSFPVSGLRFSEYGGETSCYVVKKDDYAVVVDCGTGLKNAVKILQDCKKIDILLTHVHYDHILGLLMSQFPTGAEIRLFGHFSAWNPATNTLQPFMEHPYWPISMANMEKNDIVLGKEVALDRDITATFYASDHPDNGCVIVLMCQSKKVTFLFDCEQAQTLPDEISRDSDVLFFDGMFDDNDTVDHRGWGHGTWQNGVRFSEGRNIKKLVITHHSPELNDHVLMLRENEARKKHSHISFAKIGDIHIV